MQGVVVRINVDRGFGFIRTDQTGPDAFVHFRDLAKGLEFDETLIERRVEFDVVTVEKGLRARNVRPAE